MAAATAVVLGVGTMINLGFDMKYYIDVMAATMDGMASSISLGEDEDEDVDEFNGVKFNCVWPPGELAKTRLGFDMKYYIDVMAAAMDRMASSISLGEDEVVDEFEAVKFNCVWPPGELAKTRLQHELKRIRGNLPISCTIVPVDDDIFYWEATLMGPDDSPYEGGVFYLTFRFSRRYPLEPPEVLFKTQIFHPNIDSKGNMCLWKEWLPGTDVATILVNIHCLLMEVDIDNMVVPEIADMYVKHPFRYEMMARSWTCMYAK